MPTSRERIPVNAAETAESLLKVVQKLATELHPHWSHARVVTLDTSLDRDLGLDSLARVELLVRIERSLGVTLPEQIFAEAETPRDLLRAVLGARSTGASAAAVEPMHLDLGEGQAAPDSAQTLVDVLRWHVKAHPDRPHIRFYSDEGEGDTLTYGRLMEGARALATGLLERDLKRGDRVAIMLPTEWNYFFAFFGILLAGGVPIPIYPPVRQAQLEDHLRRQRVILDNCGATILITVPEAKRFARLLKSQVESLHTLATVEEISSHTGAYVEPVLSGQDTALIQYTSGSTGAPKGVILTHANLLANIRAMGEALQAKPTDVFVSWLPLYHDMGLIGAWLGNLYYASLLVIMSPLAFITRPQRWLWAIHHYRGTLSAAPNFAYELCVKRVGEEDLKGLDLSSWRAASNGAEFVVPDTLERFCERFGEYGFQREALMPVYGMAECSVGLTFPPLGRGPLIDKIQREPFLRHGLAIPTDDNDLTALRFAACGHPLAAHEIRVVDSNGRELPERQEGHLQFRGPSATSGYFRNAEQTGRLFQKDWLNTGDLAYIANGEAYVTGRIKDIIIRAGRNIYPQELEEAVGEIAGIRKGNVAVFGSKASDSGTERLVVIAETHEKEPPRLDDLRDRINALAMDLLGTPPDDVVLAPPKSILKTSSGKIRRSATCQLYERGKLGKPHKAIWWQVIRIALEGLVPELRRAGRRVSLTAYAAYSWALFGLLTPVVWVAVALLPGSSWRWSFIRRTAHLLARASGTPFMVQGLENLKPEQAYVFVANHSSYLDSFVVVAALPRELSFVAKAELAQRFGVRFFLQRLQTEYVERFDRQKGIEDARRVGETLRSGRSLVFFPEGTFTRMPGLLPFHMGAFAAAAETGVPVVPIAIRGTRSILRAYSWFPRRGAISVFIGEPIEPDETKAHPPADSWTIALKLRDSTREYILRHCGEPDLAHEKTPM